MKRITAILQNKRYISALKTIKSHERKRIYCKHDEEHFYNVARIGYILILENNLDISKELFYAAALLHDIGRALEYTEGIPHNKASAGISEEILKQCFFNDQEIKTITEAILMHRENNLTMTLTFSDILYRADKLSRACYNCTAEKDCKWENNKKNLDIEY
jgi:HD superfamily phosphodiesterase